MASEHLIHIGYPKAGSTFLQAWFERHPELCYQPGGIGGFRDVYELARPSERRCRYFVTSYEGLSTPQKSAGDVNLFYGGAEADLDDRRRESQAGVCSLLKSLFPHSRILIVTRGFQGMILSGYSQYIRMGGRLQLKAMCGELADHLRNDTLHFYDLDDLIELYRKEFGEENVIVLPFELLRDDEENFLLVLEERLGLKHIGIKLGRVNPSLSPEELYWYPLISRTVSAMASRLGPERFKRVYRWYISKTMENRLRGAIRLVSKFRPSARITEDDFPSEVLEHCRGKAAQICKQPLYEPYGDEYLRDG